jgi:hypothetical protein
MIMNNELEKVGLIPRLDDDHFLPNPNASFYHPTLYNLKVEVKITLRRAVYLQSFRLGVDPLRLTVKDIFFN